MTNKKTIFVIIILISFALIGLVGIQLSWIENAIAIREANFNKDVNEALTNVVVKLEKIELSKKLKNNINESSKSLPFFSFIDSLNGMFFKEVENMSESFTEPSDSAFKYSFKKIKIEYSKTHSLGNDSVIDSSTVSYNENAPIQIEKSSNKINQITNPQPIRKHDHIDSLNNRIDVFFKKSSIVSDLFEDMVNLEHYDRTEKRINPLFIDSLINVEMKYKGIRTDYEFGIYSTIQNKFIFEKTGRYSHDLQYNGFMASIFPNNLFMPPQFLMLYFPQQKQYILTQMWSMLSISAILLLVIIFSFSYTIFTIYKQKKLSEMKNDFINNMTHEFKTPISTISLACQALNDPDMVKSDDLYNSYLSVINEENKRLETLAEKVLQTALLDHGHLKLRLEEVNLHQIIDDVLKSFILQLENNNGELILQLNANNDFVLADKVHISNVFYNLLDNANKYSPKNPKIIIETENINGHIVVRITDNGIGISKLNQKRIFENLFRVSTGNVHNVKGFGLGLSYVKAIVEKHKGAIHVESELKNGSTFIISIPLEKTNF
jgi:two-component system phosphate regulon sensor histidine kinase PhoR